MKKLKVISAVALTIIFIFTGCNSSTKKEPKKETVKQETAKVDVLETTEVDVQIKPSDEYFSDAIVAFDKKENAKAAQNIQKGIEAFKKETATLTGEQKKLADAAIKDLQGLDEKIEKGTLKSASDLDKAIFKAQTLNTHLAFVTIDDFFIPEKEVAAKSNFSKAMHKLRALEAKDKTAVSNEWKDVVKQGEAIEKKIDDKAKVTDQEVKNFKDALNKWLKKKNVEYLTKP